MKRQVFILLLVIFSAITGEAPTGGAWRTLAPMPSARQEISTAVHNGKIFVIAGFTSTGDVRFAVAVEIRVLICNVKTSFMFVAPRP